MNSSARFKDVIGNEAAKEAFHTRIEYFKNPEATAQVIDKDGWLHTGDLGTVDADGNIFIRKHNKTMILNCR